jgi:hypothetical protein
MWVSDRSFAHRHSLRMRTSCVALGWSLQIAIAFAFLALSPIARAQTDWLDQIPLSIQSKDGNFSTGLSGLLDLEGYRIDQRPPGLIFYQREYSFNPRLSMFLDTRLGPHVYSLVQLRIDRGFDPGSKPNGDIRLDEYLLRWTPFDDARVNFQFGKFATVFGNWVPRHDSWSNPFITAPLPYENVTGINDKSTTINAAAQLGERQQVTNKKKWLPVLWGPAYTSGGAVFGSIQKFDYAVDVKNASISSRPSAWDATRLGYDNPTVTGRIGIRPDAAWNIGASASYGAYLLPAAAPTLPPGTKLGNYNQTTIGSDVSFSWHHWQIWGEAMAARFEVPNVGNADTITYYLETKYKLTANLFAALRWNQQFFDKIPDGLGGMQRWDNDLWRIDTALGWRFDRHLQMKLQYSFERRLGSLQQGEQLVAAQMTLKF